METQPHSHFDIIWLWNFLSYSTSLVWQHLCNEKCYHQVPNDP